VLRKKTSREGGGKRGKDGDNGYTNEEKNTRQRAEKVPTGMRRDKGGGLPGRQTVNMSPDAVDYFKKNRTLDTRERKAERRRA